jgi:putative mRNA 3-end processing factor
MIQTQRDLLSLRPEGLFCEAGQFYVDPWRPVDRAVITHGHSDHARPGHRRYLCHHDTSPILKTRLGADISVQGLGYGETVQLNGVKVSLHPAGHVLGSAQVRVEHGGEVWVVSGDYKLGWDPTCTAFEPVKCDAFITESTFGLPIYQWPTHEQLAGDINRWWQDNASHGRSSVIYAYAFGKAQRILASIDPSIGPVLVHGAVEVLNQAYQACGVALPSALRATDPGLDRTKLQSALVIAPPSAAGSAFLKRFPGHSDAFASGWMQVRAAKRRRAVDRGFVMSDHADWAGLCDAIRSTGAERVLVTHGSTAVMVRWLREHGWNAAGLETPYGDEDQPDIVGHE